MRHPNPRYHPTMATIHIPEAEAERNFSAVMAHIRAGSEVLIERDSRTIAIVSPPKRLPGNLLSEIIARAETRASNITLDGGFARDLEDAIHSHREPLDPPKWD
jgi:antitoxin (DNA-binding transcriptional repressor) of toxin-antitoxin stability system